MKNSFKQVFCCSIGFLVLITSLATADNNSSNRSQELKTGVMWTTHCKDDEIYSFVFRDDMSFQANNNIFNNGTNCQRKFLTSVVSGRYQLAGSSSDVTGANKIDLHYSSSTITLHEDFLVRKWNQEKVYGYVDWKIGVPKDVMGKSYSPKDTPTFISLFSVYKVEDTKMYLGQDNANKDGSTLEKRHVKLDKLKIYSIQDK